MHFLSASTALTALTLLGLTTAAPAAPPSAASSCSTTTTSSCTTITTPSCTTTTTPSCPPTTTPSCPPTTTPTCPPTTTPTAPACCNSPAPVPPPNSTGDNIIRPGTTSIYNVWTGAVTYDSPSGKIFKDGHSADLTTLLTFDFPASLKGKTCEFHFALPASGSASGNPSGTAAFDVFTSLAPAGASSTTWPSGNLRDQYLGRMVAHAGAEATWVEGMPMLVRAFPCPAGVKIGGELVGTGDKDSVTWTVGAAGPYIKWY